jgi:hypothetical protein
MKKQKGRLIRLDDFPGGDKILSYRDYTILADYLNIFEKYRVNYILATSPLLYTRDMVNVGSWVKNPVFNKCPEICFLRQFVKTGQVVMHGFDHGFSLPWNTICETWEGGGEFEDLTKNKISTRYDKCHKILKKIKRYNSTHFVPPFNAINQKALDVLSKKGVKYIHLNSFVYEECNQDLLDFKGMKKLISHNAKTYGHAKTVLQNLDDPSTITLHWIYDADLGSVEELAKMVGRK